MNERVALSGYNLALLGVRDDVLVEQIPVVELNVDALREFEAVAAVDLEVLVEAAVGGPGLFVGLRLLQKGVRRWDRIVFAAELNSAAVRGADGDYAHQSSG